MAQRLPDHLGWDDGVQTPIVGQPAAALDVAVVVVTSCAPNSTMTVSMPDYEWPSRRS